LNEERIDREEIAGRYGDDLMFANGFDDSIIGVSIGISGRAIVYDADKMAKTLITRDEMEYSEAWEFLEYNTFNAHVGDNTPVFVVKFGEEDEL